MLIRHAIQAAFLVALFLGAHSRQASAGENLTEVDSSGNRHRIEAINDGDCTEVRIRTHGRDTRTKLRARTSNSSVRVTNVLAGGTLDAVIEGRNVDAHLFAGVPCRNPVRQVFKGKNKTIVGVGKCQP